MKNSFVIHGISWKILSYKIQILFLLITEHIGLKTKEQQWMASVTIKPNGWREYIIYWPALDTFNNEIEHQKIKIT